MPILSFLAAAVVARLKPENVEIVHHRELERLNERILQLIVEREEARDQALRWQRLARRWEERYHVLAGASATALRAKASTSESPPLPPLHSQKLGAQTLNLDPNVWCNCVPSRAQVWAVKSAQDEARSDQ